MHRRSFASEGTLPKATRRARKRVRGNAEAWVSTLQDTNQPKRGSRAHVQAHPPKGMTRLATRRGRLWVSCPFPGIPFSRAWQTATKILFFSVSSPTSFIMNGNSPCSSARHRQWILPPFCLHRRRRFCYTLRRGLRDCVFAVMRCFSGQVA